MAKKKAANNKRKGSQYERDIARLLGIYLFNDPEVFWRSAGSGSTSMKQHQGDIIAVKPEGKVLTDKYVIECKNVKSVDIFKFMINEKDIMRKWTIQVERETSKSNSDKRFLLIFHKYGTSDNYMLLPYNEFLYDHFTEPKLVININARQSYMIAKFTEYNIKQVVNYN